MAIAMWTRTSLVAALLWLFATAAVSAAPMTFRKAGSDVRFCPESCDFIQATGEITKETPAAFEKFLREKGGAGVVRLHSGGGDLQGGLELGELFRKNGVVTEVGSDEHDPTNVNYHDKSPWTRRIKGRCASACAYAFLGGVSRRLLEGDRLGVHRFYRKSAIENPEEKLFTGADLDGEQRTVALIALYMVRMGVDAGFLTLADQAGPDEMRWVSTEEASRYRVAFDPGAWKPWRIETFRGGVLAISETVSGRTRMIASCSKRRGPQLVLTSQTPNSAEWLENCKDLGPHPVLGEIVPNDRVEVLRLPEGAGSIRFRLPTANPRLTSSGLFQHSTVYPTMCSAMGWGGSSENMAAAVRAALRNCFSD